LGFIGSICTALPSTSCGSCSRYCAKWKRAFSRRSFSLIISSTCAVAAALAAAAESAAEAVAEAEVEAEGEGETEAEAEAQAEAEAETEAEAEAEAEAEEGVAVDAGAAKETDAEEADIT
jgi:hypothetical protein